MYILMSGFMYDHFEIYNFIGTKMQFALIFTLATNKEQIAHFLLNSYKNVGCSLLYIN